MSELISVSSDKKEKIAANGNAIVIEANTAVVLTSAQYEDGIKLLDVAKDFQKAVKKVWDPVCDAANTAHKAATSARKEQIGPFMEAEKTIKGKLNEYDIEQERIAEVERKRQQKLRDDEAARILKEQDDKLAEALKLEQAGDTAGAEALVDDAADLQEEMESRPAPVIEKNTPSGVSYIDNWKAVITVPNAVPREYCIPDQSKLDKLAKAFKGENAPEGVKFVNNRTIRRA